MLSSYGESKHVMIVTVKRKEKTGEGLRSDFTECYHPNKATILLYTWTE